MFSGNNIKCHASVVSFNFLPSPLFCRTRCSVLSCILWRDMICIFHGLATCLCIYVCIHTLYWVATVAVHFRIYCDFSCTVFAWRLLEGKRNVIFRCKGAMYIQFCIAWFHVKRSQRCYTTCMFSWPVLKRKLTLLHLICSFHDFFDFFLLKKNPNPHPLSLSLLACFKTP